MDKIDFENKENNIPWALKFIDKISNYLPPCNNLFGIIFYSFIIYVFGVLIKIFCSKPFNYYEEDEEEKYGTGYEKKVRERIEANRQKRAVEAEKLLKKIN